MKDKILKMFQKQSGGDGFEPDWEILTDKVLALFNSNLKEEREEYKSTLLEKVKKAENKVFEIWEKKGAGYDEVLEVFTRLEDQIVSIIGEILRF